MRTKRVTLTLVLLIIVALALPASSMSTLLDTPAATVNLIRNRAITNAEVDQMVSEYTAQGVPVDRTQVLNIMINDEVFLQGTERDGVVIDDQTLDQVMAQQKSYVESQAGQRLSDSDYRQIITSQTGLSYDEYRESIREQLLVNQYLMLMKGTEIENEVNNLQISDSAVETYYRRNRQSFYSPENVRLAHIFIPYDEDERTNSENASLLIGVAERIRRGSITFEQAVQDYSQDEASRSIGGDIGWLTMDNEQARLTLGDDFVDAAISLNAGEVSGMLTSNAGYHIVKVSVHTEGKILSLDERINPEQSTTLREYIMNALAQQESSNIISNALNDLISELRSQARIRIY